MNIICYYMQHHNYLGFPLKYLRKDEITNFVIVQKIMLIKAECPIETVYSVYSYSK